MRCATMTTLTRQQCCHDNNSVATRTPESMKSKYCNIWQVSLLLLSRFVVVGSGPRRGHWTSAVQTSVLVLCLLVSWLQNLKKSVKDGILVARKRLPTRNP